MEPRPVVSEEGKEFLEALSESTREVYEPGLGVFLAFYKPEYGGTLEDFLDALEEDLERPRRERKRVGRNVLRQFVKWMEKQGFKPKTIRTYVNSVQSLAAYYEYRLSARYVNLPTSQPVSKKYPWTVEKVAEFVQTLPTLQLQSIAVSTFQSGLGPADLLDVIYGDIKREYELKTVPLCFDFARKKTDVPFMTFIGEWGFSLLHKFLSKRRLKAGDKIYWMPHRTITYHFGKAGERWLGKHYGLGKDYEGQNPCRLYSLRAAFRTLLGDARLQETYIEFFMGHEAPEQRRVYVSKSREGWRKTYRKYEYALTPSD